MARLGAAGGVALSLFDRLEEVFGRAALADSLFYQHSPALRFELAGGETPVAQFLQALGRARAVLDTAFAGAEELLVALQVWEDKAPDPTAPDPTVLWQEAEAALKVLGITPPTPELRVLPEEDATRVLFALSLPAARMPELLWGIFAADLGITPALPARLTLAAPELGVLACPYDSRGMDIIGPNTERLGQLYADFDGWLLDYDRARMAAMLGRPPA